jgi:hypothetical protein
VKTVYGSIDVGNTPGVQINLSVVRLDSVQDADINATFAATYGTYALIASFATDSLHVIDCSDPSNLSIAGSIEHDSTNLNQIGQVVTQGTVAIATTFAGAVGGVTSIDLSDPTNPTVISHFTHPTNYAGASGICLIGTDLALVACQSSDSLLVVDFSNPAAMTEVDWLQNAVTLSNAFRVAANTTATNAWFVNRTTGGTRINRINISNPAAIAVGGGSITTTLDTAAFMLFDDRPEFAAVPPLWVPSITNELVAWASGTNTPTVSDQIGSSTQLSRVEGLALVGPYLICPDENNNCVTIVDAHDPYFDTVGLSIATSISESPYFDSPAAVCAIDGDTAIIGAGDYISSIRLSGGLIT